MNQNTKDIIAILCCIGILACAVTTTVMILKELDKANQGVKDENTK